MNSVELLFAKNVAEWIFVAFFVAVWVFGQVVRLLNQGGGKQQRPANPRPVRPAAGRTNETADNIDRILSDLGIKEKPPARQSAPAVAQARSRARQAPTRQPSPPTRKRVPIERPEVAPSTTVRKRHLESEIGSRHRDEFHSSVEQQHLMTNVSALSPIITGDAVPAPRAAGDPVLQAMMKNNQQIVRAFVLGQILGTPVGFQRERSTIDTPF